MCFMTMCPYTPPHEWDVRLLPHLMLRHPAPPTGRAGRRHTTASKTPRGGPDRNGPPRPHLRASHELGLRPGRTALPGGCWRLLPASTGRRRCRATTAEPCSIVRPREGRRGQPAGAGETGARAVIYATCFANVQPARGRRGGGPQGAGATNGVETAVVYPRCCGMPQLEEGDIERVADNARHVLAAALGEWIDKGYDVIGLVASCARSCSKLEWPLILPDDPAVGRLAAHSHDIL